MPLYESRKFSENRIAVNPEWRDALAVGPEAVVGTVARLIAERKDGARPLRLAFDGTPLLDRLGRVGGGRWILGADHS